MNQKTCEYHRKYAARRRDALKAQGLCTTPSCGNQAIAGKFGSMLYCADCQEWRRKYHLEYYHAHKSKHRRISDPSPQTI